MPESACREDRSKKVQRRINKALAQADGGSAWGAGAGAAATLARDARKGNGRVCYGARCAAGGGSPQSELSLLAPAAATSEMHLRTGHAKGAQPSPAMQVGSRQARARGSLGLQAAHSCRAVPGVGSAQSHTSWSSHCWLPRMWKFQALRAIGMRNRSVGIMCIVTS